MNARPEIEVAGEFPRGARKFVWWCMQNGVRISQRGDKRASKSVYPTNIQEIKAAMSRFGAKDITMSVVGESS